MPKSYTSSKIQTNDNKTFSTGTIFLTPSENIMRHDGLGILSHLQLDDAAIETAAGIFSSEGKKTLAGTLGRAQPPSLQLLRETIS